MDKLIKIGSRKIGEGYRPFIIAEISANHNQSFIKAKKLIYAAYNAGVDAIKLQTFLPSDLTLNVNKKDFVINDKNSLWHGYSLYDLYKKAFTPWKWHQKLFKLAKKLNLIAFSSVFDEKDVKKLVKIGVPAFKIASFENNHFPLIKKVLNTNKPVIISLGASTKKEVQDLLKITKKHRNKKVIFLKCTSVYPSKHEYLNLKSLEKLKKITKYPVGFSDHTSGITASLSAVALGANLIEKHFKNSKDNKSLDSKFSIDFKEMEQLVNDSKKIWESIGKDKYYMVKEELKSRIFKRSIYISQKILANQKITKKNIKIVRPGYSLSPRYINFLIGKKMKINKYPGDRIKLNEIY